LKIAQCVQASVWSRIVKEESYTDAEDGALELVGQPARLPTGCPEAASP